MKGKFFVFEGLDGSGKSTQAALLADFLRAEGRQVILTKEPTVSSAAGKKIREFFQKTITLSPTDLQLLFAEDRKEHLRSIVVPGIEQGAVVISDRYFFSSLAYGTSEALPWDWLANLNKDFLRPDAIIVIDVPPEISMERIAKRGEQKTYFEKLEKLKKVAEGYQKIPTLFNNVFLIDGTKPVPEVAETVHKTIIPLL